MQVASLLSRVRKPSRYLGNEFHVVRKNWQAARCRMALVFPDLYEIGMSHQGLQILYHIVNHHPDFLAERAYAPDTDLEALLRQAGEPLFALESRRPLAGFDILGFTLPYELCYTNILTVLDLAGLPLRAAERGERFPLVVGGGSCSHNPEPLADFFDCFFLGDGEEAVLEIAETVAAGKEEGLGKRELLRRLARLPGVYVPSFFEVDYQTDGRLAAIRPLEAGYHSVRRRILPSLENSPVPEPPLVPLHKIVHDRLGVEVARGCTRGCRFCQAGMIYRPVRERSVERVREIARRGLEAGGFDELALQSLSTGDYSCLPELFAGLMGEFAGSYVSVALPSMRVGTLTSEIMEHIRSVRKTGFTVAPEAGSDRLRRVLNKGITEEDLLETCRVAFSLGWNLMKFYFMFGLPTETGEDVEAIGRLAGRALATTHRKSAQVNVAVATFVPKPHTPFQWEPQISVQEGFDRLDILRRHLPRRGARLKFHDPRQSFMEGVLSRGDRRLGRVIEAVWRAGARLDGWSEHYRLDHWQQAAEKCTIDLDFYLRRREFDEILPWQHLSSGVEVEFLKKEYERGLLEAYTPDCRYHGCAQCGVCDFKTVQPIVCERQKQRAAEQRVAEQPAERQQPAAPAAGPEVEKTSRIYRLTYSRTGDAALLSHLELLQVFFRSFRRAHLPLNFSGGFNPTPKVTFGPALPVGTESLAEYMDLDLAAGLVEPAAVVERLNGILPRGLAALDFFERDKRPGWNANAAVLTGYRIELAAPLAAGGATAVADFMAASSVVIRRVRKGKSSELEVRPLVENFSVAGDQRSLELVLLSEPSRPGVKPLELVEAVCGEAAELDTTRVVKLWWRATGEG